MLHHPDEVIVRLALVGVERYTSDEVCAPMVLGARELPELMSTLAAGSSSDAETAARAVKVSTQLREAHEAQLRRVFGESFSMAPSMAAPSTAAPSMAAPSAAGEAELGGGAIAKLSRWHRRAVANAAAASAPEASDAGPRRPRTAFSSLRLARRSRDAAPHHSGGGEAAGGGEAEPPAQAAPRRALLGGGRRTGGRRWAGGNAAVSRGVVSEEDGTDAGRGAPADADAAEMPEEALDGVGGEHDEPDEPYDDSLESSLELTNPACLVAQQQQQQQPAHTAPSGAYAMASQQPRSGSQPQPPAAAPPLFSVSHPSSRGRGSRPGVTRAPQTVSYYPPPPSLESSVELPAGPLMFDGTAGGALLPKPRVPPLAGADASGVASRAVDARRARRLARMAAEGGTTAAQSEAPPPLPVARAVFAPVDVPPPPRPAAAAEDDPKLSADAKRRQRRQRFQVAEAAHE